MPVETKQNVSHSGLNYLCRVGEGGDQFLETDIQSLHGPLATVTQQSPHKNDMSNSSFPFAFYWWIPISWTCWTCETCWSHTQQKYMTYIAARDCQTVADAVRSLKWNKALKIVLALHPQDNSIVWIQMVLSESRNSSTHLRAFLLEQRNFTLIFITFGFDLYFLRATCLVVPISKFVVAFYISVHSRSKCLLYSYKCGYFTMV